MEERIKNIIRYVGYIFLIMILLLGSLPLTGVFAEVTNTPEYAFTNEWAEEKLQDAERNVTEEAEDSGKSTFMQEIEVTEGVTVEDAEAEESRLTEEPEIEESRLAEEPEIEESRLAEESEVIESTLAERTEMEESMFLDEPEFTEVATEEESQTITQEKSVIQLRASIEKEGHFSYREDYGKSVLLSFFVDECQVDTELLVTVVSTNGSVISIEKQQENYSVSEGLIACTITGVGEAELIIDLVENELCEAEELRIPVKVTDSSIKDEDFEISYLPYNSQEKITFTSFTGWKQFLEQHGHWLSGTIQLAITQTGEKFYEEIYMKNEIPEEAQYQKRFEMAEEMPLQICEIWLGNSYTNTSTGRVENGRRTFQVGIDRTAPRNISFSYNQNAYEMTSTECARYYSDNVVLSGMFEDSLSGIDRIEYTIQADLGEYAKWETMQGVSKDGTKVSFEQILGQGIYTGVAVRAIDRAGNISETTELRNDMGDFLQIIVDNREPILDIMLKTQDENGYQGEWTNQGITITVQENTTDQTIAGIQSIQYQYVSIGGEYQSEQWIELPLNEEIKIGYEENVKTNQNGTYYFRGISKSGVITDRITQEKTAVRIRLQQSLPEKQKKVEKLPEMDENQEWYNKKTGVPMISFAYPQYDMGIESLEYGAPITVYTRLTQRLGEGKEEVIEKTVTIGIQSDEQYRELFNRENYDIEQNTKKEKQEFIGENVKSLDIDFSYDSESGYAKDGIYELEYWIRDAAGNESEHDNSIYKIDTHEPQNMKVLVDGIRMQEDNSQTIVYERFYQSAVSGSASADFGVSGKRFIKLMLTEETEMSVDEKHWQESDAFVIKPCERGQIYMLAEDVAGNQAILKTQGIVVDNQEPKGEHSGKFIKLLTTANENLFYNDDITFSLLAEDMPQEKGFSGIEVFSYVIGTTEKEQRKEIASFTKALPGKEELIEAKKIAATEILDAETYEGNHTYIEIMVKDRCGNVAIDREEIKIDVTVPKVEIEFDTNVPGKGRYYSKPRTATIQIQELNFDGSKVRIETTKNGELYPVSISEWHTEGMNHWADITFSEDGDYTMSVICTDLAGNTSEEIYVEPFTVDVTRPMLEIAYQNKAVRNECYYQTMQTVTILVKEHNFSTEDFILEVEPKIIVGEWKHIGDEHSLELFFKEDNLYRFRCSVSDLAGNEAEVMEEESFVIDSIAPQIVIQGIEDNSANAGEVNPIVMVYDTNPDVNSVEIKVTTGLEEQIAVSTQIQEMESGYAYYLTDMSQKEDNVYFMNITALDMAGNSSTLAYRFSLNRHGSTYDLSKLVPYTERVYNRYEQLTDLCITEMNVDEIEEYAFYITKNGKMYTCIETEERPQDFSEEGKIYYTVEKEGDERKGYKNQYLFYRENFDKEGIYRITGYSKDRAGNESNNTLEEKKAEISFVIDNTSPKVVVNGIEEGGIYNEEARKVNIMVQDNFLLEQAIFSLVTESGEILESWDYFEFVQNAGDMMTVTIPSRQEKQFLAYQVSDAAGNELVLLPDTEKAPKGFLITTDTWLRFISSPIKVMVSVIGCIGVIAAGLFYVKKKDVES